MGRGEGNQAPVGHGRQGELQKGEEEAKERFFASGGTRSSGKERAQSKHAGPVGPRLEVGGGGGGGGGDKDRRTDTAAPLLCCHMENI